MRGASPTRSCRNWVVALGALLSWAALAPSDAQAACGRRGASSHLHFEHEMDLAALAEGGETAAPAGGAPERPGPCSGPSCSRRPAAPPAPVVSAPSDSESWACLCTPIEHPACGSLPSSLREIPVRPSHDGPSLLRPPRPGAPTSR
jgi:hypothetical protein